MKILAFDQATHVTGFAVLDGGKLAKHGVLTAKASLPIMERIYQMSDMVAELIEAEQPDVVCFEGVEGVKNERTMMLLANLQGMCLSRARQCGHVASTIDVATWRHRLDFVMGRGIKRDDLKAQAVAFVAREYDLACGDDEAEAICIAVAVNKSLDSKEKRNV